MSGVRTLGRRASFRVVTTVVAHTLWTSAAPSMTYRLYASTMCWRRRISATYHKVSTGRSTKPPFQISENGSTPDRRRNDTGQAPDFSRRDNSRRMIKLEICEVSRRKRTHWRYRHHVP